MDANLVFVLRLDALGARFDGILAARWACAHCSILFWLGLRRCIGNHAQNLKTLKKTILDLTVHDENQKQTSNGPRSLRHSNVNLLPVSCARRSSTSPKKSSSSLEMPPSMTDALSYNVHVERKTNFTKQSQDKPRRWSARTRPHLCLAP
jgi:hypothetical protein